MIKTVPHAENPRPVETAWGDLNRDGTAVELLERRLSRRLLAECQPGFIALWKAWNNVERQTSPSISPEMAAHIRFLVNERGLFQHQAAALCGVNQGRVSEVMRGYHHPDVPPAQGAFPF